MKMKTGDKAEIIMVTIVMLVCAVVGYFFGYANAKMENKDPRELLGVSQEVNQIHKDLEASGTTIPDALELDNSFFNEWDNRIEPYIKGIRFERPDTVVDVYPSFELIGDYREDVKTSLKSILVYHDEVYANWVMVHNKYPMLSVSGYDDGEYDIRNTYYIFPTKDGYTAIRLTTRSDSGLDVEEFVNLLVNEYLNFEDEEA